jgi:hypothetical protein
MPHLLSLPREIRDDIYKWLLRGAEAEAEAEGHQNSGSHRARLRRVLKPVTKSAVEPDVPIPTTYKSKPVVNPGVGYYDYEETIRYPASRPMPPSEALARAHPRLHDEVKDAVARAEIHYKVKLGWRSGLERWMPTWLSVPAFTSRVDVLEVVDCEHKGKPSSLWSLDDCWKGDTDAVYAGLALLKRFLERGTDLLSDTTDSRPDDQRGVTVGLLVFQLRCIEDQRAEYVEDSFKDFADDTDHLLLGMDWAVRRADQLAHEDEILTFVSERVTRLELRAAGGWVRSWDMKETMVERERIKREYKGFGDSEDLRRQALPVRQPLKRFRM